MKITYILELHIFCGDERPVKRHYAKTEIADFKTDIELNPLMLQFRENGENALWQERTMYQLFPLHHSSRTGDDLQAHYHPIALFWDDSLCSIMGNFGFAEQKAEANA